MEHFKIWCEREQSIIPYTYVDSPENANRKLDNENRKITIFWLRFFCPKGSISFVDITKNPVKTEICNMKNLGPIYIFTNQTSTPDTIYCCDIHARSQLCRTPNKTERTDVSRLCKQIVGFISRKWGYKTIPLHLVLRLSQRTTPKC